MKDKFEGQGSLVTFGGKYDGKFHNGKKHGFGTQTYKSGGEYEGEWVDGYMEGQGKFINKEGIIYEGEWKKGERCGKGRETKRIYDYIIIIYLFNVIIFS